MYNFALTRRRSLTVIIILAVLGSFIFTRTLPGKGKIVVVKEVMLEFLPAQFGGVTSFSALSDGGFLLVGDSGTAWAARVRSDGSIAWTLKRNQESGVPLPPPEQSEFTHGFEIGDGSVVLCGSKRLAPTGEASLITFATYSGRIDRERSLANDLGGAMAITACIPWDGGVAVFGYSPVPDSNGNPGELLKINRRGEEEWKKSIPIEVTEAQISADGGLWAMSYRGDVAKIDSDGNTARVVASNVHRVALVHQALAPSQLFVAEIDKDDHVKRIVTYDEKLSIVKVHQVNLPVNMHPGSAYIDSKGYLTFFGSKWISRAFTTTPIGTSAMTLEADTGGTEINELMPEPILAAFDFVGAVEITPDHFVSLRFPVIVGDPTHTKYTLSWVNIR